MKKQLKRLLNNKGLTLTELIVALFLTSVILAVAVGMLAPVRNLMNTLKSNAHMDTISSTVDEYIRGTLQTAKGVTFVQLDNFNNFVSGTDSDAVKNFFTTEKKEQAIAVLNINPSTSDPPVYRLFDFGEITSGGYTDLINMIGARDEEKYGAFNEPFYNGTSCAVEFYNAGGTRLQVASQCFRDGEFANQKHVLSFNLLNSSVSGFEGIAGDGTKTKVDFEEQLEITGHCYLILFEKLEIPTFGTP